VFLWHTKNLSLRARVRRHKQYTTALAFSPDGRMLASGGMDNRIRFWNVAANRPEGTLGGPLNTVLSIAFSPDGRMLASGDGDGVAKLWGMTQVRWRAGGSARLTAD
jgi:WD40 repeat protein